MKIMNGKYLWIIGDKIGLYPPAVPVNKLLIRKNQTRLSIC
ncbi:MAG: hypothetical protein RIR55_1553 [Bacteroidota bacterium]|jgi:hypothetical protein